MKPRDEMNPNPWQMTLEAKGDYKIWYRHHLVAEVVGKKYAAIVFKALSTA